MSSCFTGDGWSSRAEDAVLHGCIPVIIMDNVSGQGGYIYTWSRDVVHHADADGEMSSLIVCDPIQSYVVKPGPHYLRDAAGLGPLQRPCQGE